MRAQCRGVCTPTSRTGEAEEETMRRREEREEQQGEAGEGKKKRERVLVEVSGEDRCSC